MRIFKCNALISRDNFIDIKNNLEKQLGEKICLLDYQTDLVSNNDFEIWTYDDFLKYQIIKLHKGDIDLIKDMWEKQSKGFNFVIKYNLPNNSIGIYSVPYFNKLIERGEEIG